MDDIFTRAVVNLLDRLSGPMKIRFLLQPAMAILLALRSGLEDARAGRPPYFWAIFTHPAERRDLINQGWASIGKVFLMAIVIDAVYQIVELRWIYPGEAVAVGISLAIVPYLLSRGLVTRIACRLRFGRTGTSPTGRSSAAAAGKR